MPDEDDYFEIGTPTHKPRKKRTKRPDCTDTGGESVGRVGAASLVRVLNDPVNRTTDKRAFDYALVFCSELGIGIMREGAKIQFANFTLFSCNPYKTVTFKGASGRDKAIERFLSLYSKRKSFAYPDR